MRALVILALLLLRSEAFAPLSRPASLFSLLHSPLFAPLPAAAARRKAAWGWRQHEEHASARG